MHRDAMEAEVLVEKRAAGIGFRLSAFQSAGRMREDALINAEGMNIYSICHRDPF